AQGRAKYRCGESLARRSQATTALNPDVCKPTVANGGCSPRTAPWSSCGKPTSMPRQAGTQRARRPATAQSLMALNQTGVHHGIRCRPWSSPAVEQGQDRWAESTVQAQGHLGTLRVRLQMEG